MSILPPVCLETPEYSGDQYGGPISVYEIETNCDAKFTESRRWSSKLKATDWQEFTQDDTYKEALAVVGNAGCLTE